MYAVIGIHVVTAEDFLKVQSKLVLQVSTRQSIQRDQILFFETKGSTFATEKSNILINSISNLKYSRLEVFLILFLDPQWGPNVLAHDHLRYARMKKSLVILETSICV